MRYFLGGRMGMRFLIIIFLGVIFYSLGSALFYLVREKDAADAKRVAKALTWRIGLSLTLFFFLLLAFALGWVTPHAI